MTLAAWVTTLVMVAVTVIATPLILRHLPRPPDAPDYPALLSPQFLVTVGAIAGAASGVVTWALPVVVWPAWLALTMSGTIAVVIDAHTTWLPRAITHAGCALIGAGVITTALAQRSWLPVTSAALGAVAVGGFFHLVWRLSGQLGYGDVRLMVMVGAVSALQGTQFTAWAVLCGTGLGAIYAVTRRLATGRNGPFPYGPALFAGPYLALAVRTLTG